MVDDNELQKSDIKLNGENCMGSQKERCSIFLPLLLNYNFNGSKHMGMTKCKVFIEKYFFVILMIQRYYNSRLPVSTSIIARRQPQSLNKSMTTVYSTTVHTT